MADEAPTLTITPADAATEAEASHLRHVHLQYSLGNTTWNFTMLQGENDAATAELPVDPSATVLLLLAVMLVAQIVLVWWKKNHYRSYQSTTLVLLWIFPFLLSIDAHFWRFMTVWSSFTIFTAHLMFRATRKPLDRSTPRAVYRWFSVLFKICNMLAIAGYGLMVTGFLGMWHPYTLGVSSAGFILLVYGLYFGVLGRDCAEMCADRMASNMGYFNKNGLPLRSLASNICAICDAPLLVAVRANEDGSQNENIFALTCGHRFHEACIRGWTIIGKKDTCPYCSEKVNIRGTFTNIWTAQSITWAQILDMVRYLVVWNPIILITTQVLTYFFVRQPVHSSS